MSGRYGAAMAKVTVNDRFDHPIDAVWQVVSDFGGLQKYMRGIEGCEVQGEGLGCDRIITVPGGAQIVERLTWLQPERYEYSYSIIAGEAMPFERYVSTVRLEADGEGTAITWSGHFDPKGVSEEEAKATAEGVYRGGIKGFKKHLDG